MASPPCNGGWMQPAACGYWPGRRIAWSARGHSLRHRLVEPRRRASSGSGAADERRRGIGHRLARHGLAAAIDAGLTKVVVEVAATQHSTIALFTNLGFHAEALLEDHVRDRNGHFSDLIVLAIRVDEDWALMHTVGLVETVSEIGDH